MLARPAPRSALRSFLRYGTPLTIGVLLVDVFACGGPPPRPTYAIADRGADKDVDGIADVDDACPDDAEDGLPPKANDGCPAEDPDMDGIGRLQDKCPDAKEDGQPPDPSDGCPSNSDDDDHDGVANAQDKCPGLIEDNQAPNPNDGCPGTDVDKDGVADAIDQCPQQQETYNGYRDDDGCPDSVPGTVVEYDAQSSMIFVPESMRIEFEIDSAKLAGNAQGTLGQVAEVLKAHPEINRLEIEGHASQKGDAQHNLDLTDKRAHAVAQTLQGFGIDGGRLVAIGYGKYCPAVNVGDGVDDPRNRRVLFKAVVVNGVWQKVQRGCWAAQVASVNPVKKKPVSIETKGGGV